MSSNEKNGKMLPQSRNENWFQQFLLINLRDISQVNFWKAVFAEFLGTWLLCLYTIGAGCRRSDGPPAEFIEIVLSAAFFLPVIIYALAHISGGHVNPAVSVGFLLTKRITFIKFIFFCLAQCISSVSAVFTLMVLLPKDMHGNLGLILPGAGVTPVQAVACEFIIVFLLLFGITSFLDEDREGTAGLTGGIVGLMVGTNILFAGHISGGCMNPARNFGPAIVTGNLDLQWVYWLGPMAGGALGTLVYTVFLCPTLPGPKCVCCKSKRRRGDNHALPAEEEGEEEAMMQIVT